MPADSIEVGQARDAAPVILHESAALWAGELTARIEHRQMRTGCWTGRTVLLGSPRRAILSFDAMGQSSRIVFRAAFRDRRGFTLIELVALLALTAIVAALACSAYRTYAVRGQVQQGLETAAALQRPVVQAFRRHGEVPATALEAGVPEMASPAVPPSVESVIVRNGRIDILYADDASPAIAGRKLSITPYETASSDVLWICGNEVPDPGLSPLGFAGGGRQAEPASTTIEARYLPPACR